MPNSSDFFITGDVGGGYGQSRPHDVVRVRRALHETGYGRSPDTPSTRYDKSIHDNIVGFQDDFGLEKDGWLKPGGPTEMAMNLALDAKRAGGDGAMEAFRAPFATLNEDGFKYLHDSFRLAERPESWVDADGDRLSDAQRDDIIFSRTTGRRIKRIPPNDPDLDFDHPNPVAPLARNVFGDRIMAATPTRLKSQPESKPTPPAATPPKAEPAPTQIVQAAPSAKSNSAQSQSRQGTTSNWAAAESRRFFSANNPDTDPLPTSKISSQWRIAIHGKESTRGNYQAKNGNALGRYQLTKIALQEAGMKDTAGNWTGKHGVNTDKQFLDDAIAQEKALETYLGKVENQLNKNGSMGFVGQKIQGKKAVITLTEGGLMAAAHRWGAGRVHEYLTQQKSNGWVTDESKFPAGRKDSYLAVETRLREFENKLWRSKPKPQPNTINP